MHEGFFVTLALSVGAVALLKPVPRALARISTIAGKHAFASVKEEAPKFALLRIAFGLIILWRTIDIWRFLSPSDFQDPAIMHVVLIKLLCGVLIATGLLTQYAFITCILFLWQTGDQTLRTATLGNDVGAILATLLFLVNSGRYMSLDRWLMQRFSGMRSLLLYYANTPTEATIATAKFLALFSYWLVCLYSLSMHLAEGAWMSGTAGPFLLSNNFMSLPYMHFVHMFEQYPWAVLLARIGLWLMLPWYLLVLPLVLITGHGRHYVILWGITFFLLSKFVLILGWLAEIEFLLWMAIFWSRTGIAHAQTLAVAFDDSCNLCDRTVQFVRRVDVFDRAKLMPASQNKEWLSKQGVTYKAAMEDLHGIDTRRGTIAKGYDFYIALTQHLVLLWPLYPILMLGKWVGIGPVIYRFIATRRRALFGVCTVPVPKRKRRKLDGTGEDRWQKRIVAVLTFHILLLGLGYLVAMPAPYLNHAGYRNAPGVSAHIYGIAPINVFNFTDLHMAENWFTLADIADGKETLVPVMAADGSRLEYLRSDRLIFGLTGPYRRGYIGIKGCFFNDERAHMQDLAGIYLRRAKAPAGSYHFRYRQYFQALPDVELLKQNRYVSNPVTQRCRRDFTVTYQ